jgi:hypothetical protein
MAKYKLTEMKHWLRYSNNMEDLELCKITDTDLIEYTSEWQRIQPDFEADVAIASQLQEKWVELSAEVYGNNSNQHKYSSRNWNQGKSKPHAHYGNYMSPDELRSRVQHAKVRRSIVECEHGEDN